MKTIKEVCEEYGVSRRALQGYADKDIDILRPSGYTDAGYWLYSDMDLLKLQLIQVFVEVGYSRKEIKELLELDGQEYVGRIKKTLKEIKEKRKKLDGMVRLLTTQLNTLEKLANDFPRVEVGESYLTKLAYLNDQADKKTIPDILDYFSEIKGEDLKAIDIGQPIVHALIAIDSIKERGADHKDVQGLLNYIISTFIKAFVDSDEDEAKEIFCEFILSGELFEDLNNDFDSEKIKGVLDELGKYISLDFLKDALIIYANHYKMGGN